MQKRKILFLSIIGLTVLVSLLAAGTTFAATKPNSASKVALGHYAKPLAVGTVTAINGSSFNLQKSLKGKNPKTISYTVNTSATTVFKKDGKIASLSDITIGAKVMASGTIDKASNTVTASYVYINTKPVQTKKAVSATPRFAGKVTAINGSSFIIQGLAFKNKKAVTRTVNTTNSTTYKKDGETAVLGDIALGQNVIVAGSLDKTTNTITASTVNINTHSMFFHK